MRIEQSLVFMKSGHQLQEQYSQTEKLQGWIGRPDAAASNPSDKVTLPCDLSKNLQKAIDKARDSYGLDDADQFLQPKMSMMKRMIELLMGRKIKVFNPSEITNETHTAASLKSSVEAQLSNDETEPAGWGIRYDLQETYTEIEQTTFSVQGIVKTKDGDDIAFNLELEVSRTYIEQNNLSLRLGDAAKIDPLIVNFDGTTSELTDWKFQFDLDSDGTAENIPFVTGGSAILVFDKNSDGQVNDGRELFGPSTGNGFVELAALDEDQNKWIDENDSAYNNLYVWKRFQSGDESLLSLSQAGIGALNIGYVNSPYALKDQSNTLQGQIVRTGIYLTEAGRAGTLQQVDIAI